MKTLLVTFAVLLFLLTLLSSFGGSIRVHEPYFEETPAVQPPAKEHEATKAELPPATPAASLQSMAAAVNMASSGATPTVPKIETYEDSYVPEPFEEDTTVAPF